MTLQQIKYFVEVANLLSFSKAAENLFVAQPGLSRAIKNLEQELGIPLFIRNGNRKVMLTSYGEIFLQYANSVLHTLDDAVMTIDTMRAPATYSGDVNLGCPYVMGHGLLFSLNHDFYEEANAPNININFSVGHDDSEQMGLKVLDGEYDLAFTGADHSDDERLHSQWILNQKMYVIMSVEHPLAAAKKLTFDDIKNEKIIGSSRTSGIDIFIRGLYRSHGCKPNYACHIPDWAQRVVYTNLGKGITILPDLNYDPQKTVAIELDDPMNERPIYITWPTQQHRKLSPAAEYVRDFCIHRYLKGGTGQSC